MPALVETSSLFSNPNTERIRPSQDYYLPPNGAKRLSSLVTAIKQSPISGKLITLEEMNHMASKIDARKTIKGLPQGITPDDYYGINGLSLYTESATLTYTDQFVRTARANNQPWLGEFILDVWTPDELTHHLPFKQIALDLGASEEQLDHEIKEAQEREFSHGIGYSPAHITAFGMIQEYLTMRWYQLTFAILRDASPEAAHMVNRVKQREALHTTWYRDMTAIQLEENPRLIKHMAEAYARFRMPGNEIVPHLEAKVSDWIPRLGEDLNRVKKDIISLNNIVLRGDPELAGKLVMHIAALQGVSIGPFNAQHINAALNRLGAVGYGLVGEAVMQRAGLKNLFDDRGIASRIRGVLRTQIAEHLPL